MVREIKQYPMEIKGHAVFGTHEFINAFSIAILIWVNYYIGFKLVSPDAYNKQSTESNLADL